MYRSLYCPDDGRTRKSREWCPDRQLSPPSGSSPARSRALVTSERLGRGLPPALITSVIHAARACQEKRRRHFSAAASSLGGRCIVRRFGIFTPYKGARRRGGLQVKWQACGRPSAEDCPRGGYTSISSRSCLPSRGRHLSATLSMRACAQPADPRERH